MRRGTTPTHTFTLPFEVPEGSKVRIVYVQNDKIILEHTTDQCTVEGSVVTTKLTDKETLLFDSKLHFINGKHQSYPVEIQIGIKTPEGDKLWSNIIRDTVEKCLRKDGVI